MPITYYIVERTAPGKVFDDAAALYNSGQHRGSDGLIDPTDSKYQFGGVHMGRDGKWYHEQLQREGSSLIVAYNGEAQIGHSLFFSGQFPTFASDLEWMRKMEGVVRLAYGYLTIVHANYRGTGNEGERIADVLFEMRKEVLLKRQVNVLGTEVFALPQPNLASMRHHQRHGAVCVGGVGTHTIPPEVGHGTVYYSQWATALPGWKIQLTGGRTFRVVPCD
jgi:hypothetical protein